MFSHPRWYGIANCGASLSWRMGRELTHFSAVSAWRSAVGYAKARVKLTDWIASSWAAVSDSWCVNEVALRIPGDRGRPEDRFHSLSWV
jgi:hypothetical protein